MTNLSQRIAQAGRRLNLAWNDGDLDRTWQGLVRKRQRRVRRRAVVATGAVASCLVVLLVAGGARLSSRVMSRRTSPAQETATKVTDHAGASDSVSLTDGSRAIPLRAQSAVHVSQDSARHTLLELMRGAARFEVVRSPRRTFRVTAGAVTVTALGTVFSVDRVADRVGVIVMQGEVLVDWRLGSRRLRAGEEGWFPPLVIAAPAAATASAAPDVDAAPPLALVPPVRLVPATGPGRAASRPIAPVAGPIERAAPTAPAAALAAPLAPPPQIGSDLPSAPRNQPTVHPVGGSADRQTPAARLLAEADDERLSGRFEEGAALLERLIREHAGDRHAPLAAFSLGRLLLRELNRPEEAARAFAQARALAPSGPLAEDALAREVEAWAASGAVGRARARADEYLRLYPTGRRAAAVRELVIP